MGFIDEQGAQGRVDESVCRLLREQGCQVAARTYRAWRTRQPAARAISDARLVDQVLLGLSGVRGTKGIRTTIQAKDGIRAGDLVMIPLRIALWQRGREGHPISAGQLIHHSDAGRSGRINQATFLGFTSAGACMAVGQLIRVLTTRSRQTQGNLSQLD